MNANNCVTLDMISHRDYIETIGSGELSGSVCRSCLSVSLKKYILADGEARQTCLEHVDTVTFPTTGQDWPHLHTVIQSPQPLIFLHLTMASIATTREMKELLTSV